MNTAPLFATNPKAKASFAAGALYAVDGRDGWVYYAQVTPMRDFGFFRFRSHVASEPDAALASEVMCRIGIYFPSVGQALRQGYWQKLGRAPLHSVLLQPQIYVQWPVGTHEVTMWKVSATDAPRHPHIETINTTIDDPTIQDMEIATAWDAIYHVPGRLKADFGSEPGDWFVGGPIWRQRRIAAEMARRFPDAPAHQHRGRMALLRAGMEETGQNGDAGHRA
jgi:hypothetical protein